jgi:hypothetical protein
MEISEAETFAFVGALAAELAKCYDALDLIGAATGQGTYPRDEDLQEKAKAFLSGVKVQ